MTRLDQVMTRFDSTRKIWDVSDSKDSWLWFLLDKNDYSKSPFRSSYERFSGRRHRHVVPV